MADKFFMWVIGIGLTIITIFLAGILVILGFSAYDHLTGHYVYVQGRVTEKAYSPPRSSSGIGIAATGKTGPVVTSSYESEKWILVAEAEGRLYPLQVTKEYWAACTVGSVIPIRITIGGKSNSMVNADAGEIQIQQ